MLAGRECLLFLLLYDLTFSYYPLLLCLRFDTLSQFPPTSDIIGLAGACQGGIAALAAIRTIGNVRIFDSR